MLLGERLFVLEVWELYKLPFIQEDFEFVIGFGLAAVFINCYTSEYINSFADTLFCIKFSQDISLYVL